MMDIKVVVCVVLIVVSMANNSQGLRKKRSPDRNSANGFSAASNYGGAGAFAGAAASASSSSSSSSSGANANSFAGASTNANPGQFSTNQNSWAENRNSQADNSYRNNIAIDPPSTSWMVPPPRQNSVNNNNPSSSSISPKSIPSLSSGQARPIAGYTPVISISGSFDTNDPSPSYASASAICDSNNNCNTNYNPPKSNSNYPNYRPVNNNYPQPPQQYPNQMSYNPNTYSKPNYANTNYGNPYTGNGGFASAGSFAGSGGVGGNQPSYPGNNEISVNSRFNPDQNWPGFDNDPFKWVQEQNRAIQASIQSQFNQFQRLNNQQSHVFNDDSWPNMGSNDGAWAWGSANAGPSGGSQAGAIGPVGPGIESRFAEDVSSSGGDGSYSSFSSSSSSSQLGPDGKVHTTKEVTTGVNNNGKVSIKHIKDP